MPVILAPSDNGALVDTSNGRFATWGRRRRPVSGSRFFKPFPPQLKISFRLTWVLVICPLSFVCGAVSHSIFKLLVIVSLSPWRRYIILRIRRRVLRGLSLSRGLLTPSRHAGVGQDPIPFVLYHDLRQGQGVPIDRIKLVTLCGLGNNRFQLGLHLLSGDAGNLMFRYETSLYIRPKRSGPSYSFPWSFRGGRLRWSRSGFGLSKATAGLNWDICRCRYNKG